MFGEPIVPQGDETPVGLAAALQARVQRLAMAGLPALGSGRLIVLRFGCHRATIDWSAASHPRTPSLTEDRSLMKQFACGDVVAGCQARWVCSSEEEVLAHVAAHAREAHGMTEIPDEVVAAVREHIRDVS